MARKKNGGDNNNVVALKQYQEPVPSEMKGEISSAGSFFGLHSLGGKFFNPSPYNPDSLVQKKGIRIYRAMSIDEQIKAALLAKQFAVLSTGYEIQMPQVAPEEQDEEVSDEHKKFIEYCFEDMQGSFDAKLLGIMDALAFGFSCSEMTIKAADGGPFDGKWVLADIKTRPPEDIDFQIDNYGNIVDKGVLQFGMALPTDKFVIYSYRSQYGNPYGDSDLRAAYRAYWAKDNLLKLMVVALERYAEPIPVATYKGILTPDQRADIEFFLKNLQSRSGVILPETITLDFKAPPPRSAEAFIPAVNQFDQQLRIAILMPGLMGLSGEQQVGSLARAVKEFDVFLWILGQLRKDIETVVNEQIVKRLLDYNYEIDHGQYPKFKFNAVTEEAKQRSYELFLMGLGAGALNKGPEDENKLREMIDFEPLPEDFVPPNQMDQFGPFGQQPIDQGGYGSNGFDNGQNPPTPDGQAGDQYDFTDDTPAMKADKRIFMGLNKPEPKTFKEAMTLDAEQKEALLRYIEQLRAKKT